MTLALVVLRRDHALVCTDTILLDQRGRHRHRDDGSPMECSKLLAIPHCPAVMLVRGRSEVARYLARWDHHWHDTDAAIEEIGNALMRARRDAGLGHADHSRHEAFRRGEVYVVGHSPRLGHVVCAQFETDDLWSTFTRCVFGVESEGQVRAICAPHLPGSLWPGDMPRTADEALLHARAQVAHNAALEDGPFQGINSPYGGRLVCAELTADSLRMTAPGDLRLSEAEGMRIAPGAATDVLQVGPANGSRNLTNANPALAPADIHNFATLAWTNNLGRPIEVKISAQVLASWTNTSGGQLAYVRLGGTNGAASLTGSLGTPVSQFLETASVPERQNIGLSRSVTVATGDTLTAHLVAHQERLAPGTCNTTIHWFDAFLTFEVIKR